MPFSQPFGHQEFLRLIIGIDYNRFVKNVIEEGGELVGYMLILIGTMEAVLECRRERRLASCEKGRKVSPLQFLFRWFWQSYYHLMKGVWQNTTGGER